MAEIHKLIIRPRLASTGCGVEIGAFYPRSKTALATDGRTIMKCTVDDAEVAGCAECVAAVNRP